MLFDPHVATKTLDLLPQAIQILKENVVKYRFEFQQREITPLTLYGRNTVGSFSLLQTEHTKQC